MLYLLTHGIPSISIPGLFDALMYFPFTPPNPFHLASSHSLPLLSTPCDPSFHAPIPYSHHLSSLSIHLNLILSPCIPSSWIAPHPAQQVP